MDMPSQPCLQPSAFLTCPSLTHHLRHAAERVLGHRRGQSGQRTGADQGKRCPLGSDSSLAPLGAPQPLRLSPKVCSVWLGPAPSGRPRQGEQLESHTSTKEAWFTFSEFGEPQDCRISRRTQKRTAKPLRPLRGALHRTLT